LGSVSFGLAPFIYIFYVLVEAFLRFGRQSYRENDLNMDSDVVLKVEGLHKKFCRSLKRSMAYGSIDVARNMLGINYDPGKLRKGEFWSLQDIDFELKKGEGIGIVGQNGSGKSTLLRLLNGIFPPDKGRIMVRGKIGALIAVGAGFHPHMTGRENIFLNGIILGMGKKEIEEKFDSIVEFADIGDFLDAPVATYSSGMTVRLGFSIAIHSEPEILLADEILAVGDLQFALKCHRKIADYRKNGGSLILVSHGMQLIRNSCETVLWLDKGIVHMEGEVNNVCDQYENFMFNKDAQDSQKDGEVGTHITNDKDTVITKVEFLNANDEVVSKYKVGDYFKARIHYDCKREVKHPVFTFGIANVENIGIVASYSNTDNNDKKLIGKGYVECSMENLYIKPGNYRITVTLTEDSLQNVLDWHEKNFQFTILSGDYSTHGLMQYPIKWKTQV
jgi:lipopolysaccharide transport system ATP-binding protein